MESINIIMSWSVGSYLPISDVFEQVVPAVVDLFDLRAETLAGDGRRRLQLT